MAREIVLSKCLSLEEHEVIPSDYRVYSILNELGKLNAKIQEDAEWLIEQGVSREHFTELVHLSELLHEAELRWNHTRFQHPEGVREWCAVNKDGYEIFTDIVDVLSEAFWSEADLLEELEEIVKNPNNEEHLLAIPHLVELGHANHELLEQVNCRITRLDEAALIGYELGILYHANRTTGSISRSEKDIRDKIATYAHRKLCDLNIVM